MCREKRLSREKRLKRERGVYEKRDIFSIFAGGGHTGFVPEEGKGVGFCGVWNIGIGA